MPERRPEPLRVHAPRPRLKPGANHPVLLGPVLSGGVCQCLVLTNQGYRRCGHRPLWPWGHCCSIHTAFELPSAELHYAHHAGGLRMKTRVTHDPDEVTPEETGDDA